MEDKIKLESVNFRGEVVGKATVTPVHRADEVASNTTSEKVWTEPIVVDFPHKAVEELPVAKPKSLLALLAQAILHFWGHTP